MDMAVPMVIMIKAPSKLGVILLQSTPPGPAPPGRGPGRQKGSCQRSGGHHALALQVRQVQGLAVCQRAVGS